MLKNGNKKITVFKVLFKLKKKFIRNETLDNTNNAIIYSKEICNFCNLKIYF